MLTETPLPPPLKGELTALEPLIVPPGGLHFSRNLMERNGQVMVRPGFSGSGAEIAGATSLGMIQFDRNVEDDFVVVFTEDGWYGYNRGSGAFILLGVWRDNLGLAYTPPTDAHAVARVYDLSGVPWLVAVEGSGYPNAWDGDTSHAPRVVSGSPPKQAKCCAVAGDRLLLGVGLEVWASELPALGGFDAGWGSVVDRLADTPGEIIAMSEFGAQAVAVFKEDAIYMGVMTETATAPYQWQLVAANIPGPASPRAVASLPDGSKVYLAKDGTLKRFTGQAVEQVSVHADAHLQKYASADALSTAFVAVSTRYSEVYVVFQPIGGTSRTQILVLNLTSGAIWPLVANTSWPLEAGLEINAAGSPSLGQLAGQIGDYPATLGSFATEDPEMGFMVKPATGETVLTIFNGQQDSVKGTDLGIEFDVRTGLLQPNGTGWGLFRECELFLDGSTDSLNVEIVTSDHGEAPTWGSGTVKALATGRRKLARFREFGRFFGVRLYGSTKSTLKVSGGVVRTASRGRVGGGRFAALRAWS